MKKGTQKGKTWERNVKQQTEEEEEKRSVSNANVGLMVIWNINVRIQDFREYLFFPQPFGAPYASYLDTMDRIVPSKFTSHRGADDVNQMGTLLMNVHLI